MTSQTLQQTSHPRLRLSPDRHTLYVLQEHATTTDAPQKLCNIQTKLNRAQTDTLITYLTYRAGPAPEYLPPTFEDASQALTRLCAQPEQLRALLRVLANARAYAEDLTHRVQQEPRLSEILAHMNTLHKLRTLEAAATTPPTRAAATRLRKTYLASLETNNLTTQQVSMMLRHQQIHYRLLVMPAWHARTDRRTDDRSARLQAARTVRSAWFTTPAAKHLIQEWKQAERSLESRTPGSAWQALQDDVTLQRARCALSVPRVSSYHTPKNRHRNPRTLDARYDSLLTRTNRRVRHLQYQAGALQAPSLAAQNRERLRLRAAGVPVPDATELRRHTRPDRLQAARQHLNPGWFGPRQTGSAENRARQRSQDTLIRAVQTFNRQVKTAGTFKGKTVRARHLAQALEQGRAHPLLAPHLPVILRWTRNTTGVDLGPAPRWQPAPPAAQPAPIQGRLL